MPPKLAELVTLPGVGRKTANVVLGNAFDVPGITVDTHFGRLVRRLGWTEETDPVKVEHAIGALFPKRDWTMLSHHLIWHGRRRCHAKKPACGACPVARARARRTARARPTRRRPPPWCAPRGPRESSGRRGARRALLVLTGCAVVACAADPHDPGLLSGPAEIDVDTPELRRAEGRRSASRPAAQVDGEPVEGGLPDAHPALPRRRRGRPDLGRLRGPMVVNLWASWCGPCRTEMPLLQRFHEQLRRAGAVARHRLRGLRRWQARSTSSARPA